MQTTYQMAWDLSILFKNNPKQDSNFNAFTSLDLTLWAGLTIQNLVRFAHNRNDGIVK